MLRRLMTATVGLAMLGAMILIVAPGPANAQCIYGCVGGGGGFTPPPPNGNTIIPGVPIRGAISVNSPNGAYAPGATIVVTAPAGTLGAITPAAAVIQQVGGSAGNVVSIVANSDGSFTLTLTAPTTPATYIIFVQGTNAAGQPVTLEIAIVVNPGGTTASERVIAVLPGNATASTPGAVPPSEAATAPAVAIPGISSAAIVAAEHQAEVAIARSHILDSGASKPVVATNRSASSSSSGALGGIGGRVALGVIAGLVLLAGLFAMRRPRRRTA